ncbi:hypothetical protein [Kribbella deserti]|uniref:Uncharacterized protein n=1 Tax=Kribbella deserti TaxID=1926257 RepID=A0ABV6QFI5_9ACTN
MSVVIAICAAGLINLLALWVRERHRQRRILSIVPRLPPGSVFVDDNVAGVRAQIGPGQPPIEREPTDE